MAAVQRRQEQQALSAAAANLAGLLPWSLESKSGVQSSVASVFTDYGLGLACGGVLGRNQLGVAHKTAPCGTLINFTYEGTSLTVPGINHGRRVSGFATRPSGGRVSSGHSAGYATARTAQCSSTPRAPSRRSSG